MTTIRGASALPKAPFRIPSGSQAPPPKSTAWKPRSQEKARGEEPEALTAASFPALPARRTVATAVPAPLSVPVSVATVVPAPAPVSATAAPAVTAIPATDKPIPFRSFLTIAREAHQRTEAAKADAERRAMVQREREQREAREVAFLRRITDGDSSGFLHTGGGENSGAARGGAGGYNASMYGEEKEEYGEEGGEEGEGDGEGEEDEDDGWTH